MKTSCPKCGSERIGTQEKLSAVSFVEGYENGSFLYSGDTEVFYDSSSTIHDLQGHPLMLCVSCSEEWYDLSITLDLT